jgi:hypothetical protein
MTSLAFLSSSLLASRLRERTFRSFHWAVPMWERAAL